jgi:hypothetical protein
MEAIISRQHLREDFPSHVSSMNYITTYISDNFCGLKSYREQIYNMAYFAALIATVVCLSITCLVWQRLKFRVVRREGGCKLPPKYPHKDPILGIDRLFRRWKAISQNRFLEEFDQSYQRLGKTFKGVSLGCTAIDSIEPDNLKAVFATNSNMWGNGPIRLRAMSPWVGRGFITVDGLDWQDSHTLLKPSFHRANIANLKPFENSLQQLLALIPRDGSTVDLQVLFSKLVSLLETFPLSKLANTEVTLVC